MAHTPRPISHRLTRLARDLRLSAALLVIWLIPPAAAVAKGPITVPDPGTAGRLPALDDDDARRDAAARAYIIHLPGIAGPMRFDSRFGEGLVVGQASSEVEIFDWVGKRRGLPALYGVDENLRQARKLADHIIALKAKDPARPLVITAHSGGTAIVAWALEMLGEAAEAAPEATEQRSDAATKGVDSETSRDGAGAVRGAAETVPSSKTSSDQPRHGVPPADPQEPRAHPRAPSETDRARTPGRRGSQAAEPDASRQRSSGDPSTSSTVVHSSSDARGASSHAHQSPPLVDGVLFIASGLSSDYDLSPMLRQVRGRVFHLSSRHDNLILAAGTAVFGTLDRKNGLAAGKTGFYLPEGVAPEAYERFVEVPYDRAWAEYGHYGDHEGMMTTSFASAVGADLVRASLGVPVELPATRPAQPAPAKPTTTQVKSTQPAPAAAGRID